MIGAVNEYLVDRLQPFGTTIFAEMSALAVETGAINLGQGFPDTDGPDVVKQAAIRHDPGGSQPIPARHRRPRVAHHDPRAPSTLLRARVQPGGRDSRDHGRDRNDNGPVGRVVRSGRRGRHVRAVLRLLHGVHRDGGGDASRRHAPRADYTFDPEELARHDHAPDEPHPAQLSAQPDGQSVHARRAHVHCGAHAEHDLLVVTDEVYERLVYEAEHVPIATLPGVRERTVMIGSGGKTFSFTGWKVGWVCAPPRS